LNISSRFRFPFPPISNTHVIIHRQSILSFSTSYVYFAIILYNIFLWSKYYWTVYLSTNWMSVQTIKVG